MASGILASMAEFMVASMSELSRLGRQVGDGGQKLLRLSECGHFGLGLSGAPAELRELRSEDADIRPIILEKWVSGNALAVSGEGVFLPPRDLFGLSDANEISLV